MRLNIFSKLFLAMLLATIMVVFVMVVFMNWSFRDGFAEYQHAGEIDKVRELADKLGVTFTRYGSWDFIQRDRRVWGELLSSVDNQTPAPAHTPRLRHPNMKHPFLPPPPMPPDQARRAPRPFNQRLNLLDVNQQPIIGDPHNLVLPPDNKSTLTKIEIQASGEIVGWLSVRQGNMISDNLAKTFMDQQMRNLYLIALFAVGLSFLLTVLLVRHFVRPVHSLTQGAKALTTGNFTTRIGVNTQDELGNLAQAFNTLAEALQRNESLRQQWIADISHELRTPLAILRSEIEAILDGIRKPTIDRIQSLHTDVLAMGKLVEDLHQLALSDSAELSLNTAPVELAGLLTDVVLGAETHFREKNIHLKTCFDPQRPLWINGDADRLLQLFTNLLGNSHRYTDDGGQVEILAQQQGDKIIVTLQDSAPGVPDAALPHLFERLFRVDKSRSRALGGSGLGLSICKNTVEAHGGAIRAAHSPLDGLLIEIEFPAQTHSQVV